MAQYDGTIRIDSSINTNGMNKGISSMSGMLSGLVGTLGKVAAAIGIAFGVAEIVKFSKESAQVASDLQVLQNRFSTIFGGLAGTVEEQLTKIGNATNFCEHDLMSLATTLQVAFLNLGYASTSAANSSIQVIQRAQDLATFWGTDLNTVTEAIQMGLLGMTRGLRQYNVVIDENKIKAKAQTLGLWDGVGAMSAQAKAAATLQIILDQTSYAQGNAAKTAHTWAGEMRGFSAAWEEFKAAVGNAVIIFAPIVAVVKNIIVWLTVLANEFAALVSMIFGIQIGTNAATAGIQGAADAAGALADNTTAVGKAAKGALASWDQLSVLAQDTGTGTAATPGVPGGGGLPVPTINTSALDAIQEKVKAFFESLTTLFAPASAAFERLKTALEPLGETIWAGLKWAWDNILVPLGKWVITDLLPAFLDLLTAAIDLLNQVLISLQPLAKSLFDDFLKPIAEWTGGVIISVLKDLTTGLNGITDWIKENPDTFTSITKTILTFAAAWAAVSVAMWAYNAAAAIAAGLTTAIDWPLLLVIAGVAALIAIIVLCVQHWPDISAAAITAWNWVKQAASDAWAWVVTAWGNAGKWFQNIWNSIITGVTTWWTATGTMFRNAYNGVIEIWGNLHQWFVDNVITLISTAWGIAMTGIALAASNIAGTISGVFWTMVGGIADAINWLIDQMQALGIDVANFTLPGGPNQKTVSGKVNGILMGAVLPGQAAGGVFQPNAPFAALLGDQSSGRNIEAPEGLIRQIVSEELSKTQGGGGPITINFAGSLGALVRVLQPYIVKENNRIGTSLITGVKV